MGIFLCAFVVSSCASFFSLLLGTGAGEASGLPSPMQGAECSLAELSHRAAFRLQCLIAG